MKTTENEIETTTIPPDEEQIEGEVTAENQTGSDEPKALGTEEEGDEVVVSIGDPDPATEEEAAPPWVRELRKRNRDLARENKDLKAAVNRSTENKPVSLGKKPTLDDFDFDAEKYETALAGWFEQKRKADQQEDARRDAEKVQDDAWKVKLGNYDQKKAEIKVRDFEEAEAETQNALSQTQLAIIVQGAENPALVVYALGKNPAKRKELAEIKDPVMYAFTVAKLEAQLKVTPRKPTTAPEATVSGASRPSSAVDATLDRLRDDARKTGDYSKVIRHKEQLAARKS